ncbi:hypothetical protein GCM10011369_36590 [Neiella marina]|uniref:PEP-CTERM protein-sorting domain-containing protein n=1 Tax=Neiella marina TaxID=508461 RepID=A0A8J2XRZ1_9GAMM|nr:PEP-CTERM sorting domain-containing protein [Neiella marina]GGA91167.1 hypothetical protein GCM10011369_36590 [Neiella marina]
MLKKFLSVLCLASTLVFSAASNATLISQEIIFGGAVEGSIVYDTALADDFGFINGWESFDFLGLTFDSADAFVADLEVDPTDPLLGLTFLFIDATDTLGILDVFMEWDAGFGDFTATFVTGELFDFVPFELGAVTEVVVNNGPVDVPEPSAAVLMLAGLLLVACRKKAKR